MILVSFDIDGTLAFGDPEGPLALDVVHDARRLGYVLGSSSDRTMRDQQQLWDRHGIAVDFVSHKHHLPDVRTRFTCTRFVHIGDSLVDELYAKRAGFEFVHVDAWPVAGSPGWIF